MVNKKMFKYICRNTQLWQFDSYALLNGKHRHFGGAYFQHLSESTWLWRWGNYTSPKRR